jgi:hypothetical protein
MAIFFSVNFVIAGEYIELYKKFIPESLLKNPVYHDDIERNLKTYLELDPSLLYYYFKRLNMKIDSLAPVPELNWRHLLQKHLAKSKYLKKEWAEVEISQIENKYELKIKRNEILDYYDEFDYTFFKKNLSIKPNPANENKKNFYIYLYFSKSADIKYDPQKKYLEMLKPIVEQMITTFNSKFENKNHLTKEQLKEFINIAFQYSYLFKNGYLDKFPNQTNFHIYELIAYYIKNDYINQFALSIHISKNIIKTTYKEAIKFTDPFNLKFNYPYEIESGNNTYLNIGFRYKVKELYSPFSFINISVGYAIQKPLNNTFKKHVFFSGTRIKPGKLSYTGSYYLSNYRDLKSMFITTQISLPVYYISKQIFFEAGVNFTIQQISFTYDFNLSGDVKTYDGSDIPDFYKDEEKKYDESKRFTYPVIALNYLAFRNLNFRVEYLIPKNVRLALGYYLNF